MTIPAPHPLTRRAVLQYSAALPVLAAATDRLPVLGQATPLPPNASIADLVAGNTTFALDLYAELSRSTDGNLVFSPYSISLALAMTGAGAAGETATQIAETLRFDLAQPALHETFGTLTADLVRRGNAEFNPNAYESARGLRIANALWGEQSYPFSADYTALLEQDYGAGLQQADFINAPEDAREEINAWVEDQTEDRIQDIVPPDAITKATRLVLANAIYFFGRWYPYGFDVAETRDGPFHRLDGSTVTIPFMFNHDHMAYARGDGYQVVELPYWAGEGDEGFAFTVILPDKGQFEAIEAGLDASGFTAAIGALDYAEVLLYLPKFRFSFDTSLANPLTALGMTDAFDPSLADFTGMVEGAPPEPLWIGEVLHKAFISVDEEGTEAAAETMPAMPGAAPPEPDPPVVHVDRPFLFAIRDTKTGTVLFLGRVLDPRG